MAKYYIEVDGKEIGLEVMHTEHGTTIQELDDDSALVHVDFASVHCNTETGEGLYSLIADGNSYQVHVEPTADGLRVVSGRHRVDLQVLTEREWRLKKVAPRQSQDSGTLVVKAPMPGLVKAVLVREGEEVYAGQRLVVLEAMKMENDITAARAGRTASVYIAAGETVESGRPLLALE